MKKLCIMKHFFPISRPYILTIATIFIMSEIISVICLREIFSGIWFTLFQVGGVLIPGTACVLAGGWAKGLDWRACAFSYTMGYCFSLFVYFAVMLGGLGLYARYIVIAIFLACIVFISYKNKIIKYEMESTNSGLKLILISFWVMFGIAFVASCCTHLLPPVVQDCYLYQDVMYWVGNIIELTRELPPKNFRNYPSSYSYHYFSSAQLALVSLSTSIRPIYVGMFFSVVQSVLLRVFSGYLILAKCTKSIKLQVVGMLLLFFSSGFEQRVLLTYSMHSYYAPFGMEYGLAIYLFFIYLMLEKFKEKTNQLKTSILIWACTFVLAGEKISYGAVGVFGLGVLCAGFLIKKQYKKAVITGIPACCLFWIEYFTIINLSRFVNNPTSYGVTSPISPIWEVGIGREWVLYLQSIFGALSLPVAPVLIVCFMVLGNPVCFFAVFYNCLRITKKQCWNLMDISFFSMYLMGVLVWIFVQMYGASNMYFAFASFPVAIIWLLKSKLTWNRVGKFVFAITSFVSIMGFTYGFGRVMSLPMFLCDGVSLLATGKARPGAVPERLLRYVDTENYQAYEWVRVNSKENDIIASNRIPDVVGALTERYINHPWMKNSIYVKPTDEERKQVLFEYKELGVKYIMFEARYGDKVEYLDKACDVVYQSDNIIIYAVP